MTDWLDYSVIVFKNNIITGLLRLLQFIPSNMFTNLKK